MMVDVVVVHTLTHTRTHSHSSLDTLRRRGSLDAPVHQSEALLK